MHHLQCLTVLLTLCIGCWAQVPSLGFCPSYVPMANFNINKFLGRWYEAEKYFTFSEVGSRCVETDYAIDANGKFLVSNRVTNRVTGVKRIIDGEVKDLGKGGEGQITVRFNTLPSYDTTYAILDTDYDSYAVLWSCSGIGPVHTENAWVMTRERIPPATALQKAYGVLDKYRISRAFFVKTDQEGCPVTASELAITSEEPVPQDPVSEDQKNRVKVGDSEEDIPVEIVQDKGPVQVPEVILSKSALPASNAEPAKQPERQPAEQLSEDKPKKEIQPESQKPLKSQ